MKPIAKYLLGAVVVCALASPYVAGRIIEKNYNQLIAHLNTQSKGNVNFTGKFNRGLFSSTATTEITMKDASTPIELNHFIKHGPIIFKGLVPHGFSLAEIATTFGGELQQNIDKIYNGKPAYDIATTLTLHGDINTVINSNPLNAKVGFGDLNWQGLNAVIKTDLNFDSLTASITLPMIDYSEISGVNMQQTAKISNIKIDFNNSFVTHNSDLVVTVDNSKIISNTADELDLDKLSFNFSRKVNNGLMDISFKVGFNKLGLAALNYGPLNLDMQWKNLSTSAVEEILQPQPHGVSTTIGPHDQTIPKETMVKFLTNKIEIDTNLNLTTPDGNVVLDSHTEFGGPTVTALDLKQIMPTLTADHNLQIGKKLAYKLLTTFAENQIHKMEILYYINNPTSNVKNPYTFTAQELQKTITNWINKLVEQLSAQKYIIVSNDTFSSKFDYKNNILTVNGETKTDDDLKKLEQLFIVVAPPISATPAPAPAPTTSPGTVPAQSQ